MPEARAHAGFTLIELLVVIAIIAILAAILFPVFAGAREKAKQASCTSNVKQLALAALMYAQDYDDRLPRSFQHAWVDPPEPFLWWSDCVHPYAKNAQVFECPSYRMCPHPREYDICETTFGLKWARNAYGWNQGTNASIPPYTHDRGNTYKSPGDWVSLGDFPVPAEALRLGDTGNSGCGVPCWYVYIPTHFPSVHSGGREYAFVDGHAKWLSAQTVAGKPGQGQHIADLRLPGAEGVAIAVNSSGTVAGTTRVAGGALHAFVWSQGQAVDLHPLSAAHVSQAHDINDPGHVAGTAALRSAEGARQSAAVWRDGSVVYLNDVVELPPGCRLVRARGINNHGQIVGQGVVDGRQCGFLLTPIA